MGMELCERGQRRDSRNSRTTNIDLLCACMAVTKRNIYFIFSKFPIATGAEREGEVKESSLVVVSH